MSNPETKFLINTGTIPNPVYIDLSSIFQPIEYSYATTGENANKTGFTIPGNLDLSEIFAPRRYGYKYPNPTGYVVNNSIYANYDLNEIDLQIFKMEKIKDD